MNGTESREIIGLTERLAVVENEIKNHNINAKEARDTIKEVKELLTQTNVIMSGNFARLDCETHDNRIKTNKGLIWAILTMLLTIFGANVFIGIWVFRLLRLG